MPYDPVKTLDDFVQATTFSPLLGENAIRDSVAAVCERHGMEILDCVITVEKEWFHVEVTHRDKDKPLDSTSKLTKFRARNHRYGWKPPAWELMLKSMETRQASMPEHMRGRPVNVEQERYMDVLRHVREITGYDGLSPGDLWVNHDGQVMGFGYLTRAGEIAMNKYHAVKRETLGEAA